MPAPIGAVVRALAGLNVKSPKTRATVLMAMGWGDIGAVAPVAPVILAPSFPEETQAKPSPSAEPPKEGRKPLPSTLMPLTTPIPREPDWLADVDPLPLPDPVTAVPLYAKPIDPLFSPLITRAILSRLASAPAAVGEVDVARMVEIVATGRPLHALPRRTVPTLAKGLELLIDDGRGLEPFVNDLAHLIDDLGLAVGRDLLTVRLFRGCPSDGVMEPETATLSPYVLPPAGTPVLAVTDLGTGECHARSISVPAEAWVRFAGELRSRGNPLAVLMPGSPARLPTAMLRALTLIRWDRGTGARLTDRTRATTAGDADGAERLARLASIAGRIDPQLLRALRLTLAPDVGVEAEADLWFGDLAQTAAVTGVVLFPEQQRRLQDELAGSDPDLLVRAWEILYRLRTGEPWSEREKVQNCTWLVALEELTFYALSGFGDAGPERDAVERRLAQILKLLITASETERERDAIAWTCSAQARLPARVMELKPMRHLALAAAHRGADTLTAPEMADAARDKETAYLVPRSHQVMLPVWLRLVEGGLEASLAPVAGAHRIDAPALQHLPLAIDWLDLGTLRRTEVQLDPPLRAFVELAAEWVEIALPGGSRFRLSLGGRAPLINVPPAPQVFVNREHELKEALSACLREPAALPPDAAEQPLRVFISYAQADERFRSELAAVLKPLVDGESIEVWDPSQLAAGEAWTERISTEMGQADAFLLLLTPAYLASEWCRRDMFIALRASSERSALVIPIIGRNCDWRSTSLAGFSMLPKDGAPVLERSDASARTMVWLEISEALKRAFHAHRRSSQSPREEAGRPQVVALVGPDGIGRFTLARRLVHEPAMHERYPDGILWLGEDGSGFPRQWLRDYCAAISQVAPFNDNDGVDREGFGALFADRRVLFVADHRMASDMLPTLQQHAGPECTVLVLASGAPPEARISPIVLSPLTDEAAAEMMAELSDSNAEWPALTAFASGNPLLLRLAAAGRDRLGPNLSLENAETQPASIDPEPPVETRRATILLAALRSSVQRGPDAALRIALGLGILDDRQRLALRRLIVSHPSASRFERAAVDGIAIDLDGVIRLGLVDDLGHEVRLHPLLRQVIPDIDPDTAEIASMLRELDRLETDHQRRMAIGKRLDALGDPRRGVGVGPDGTPEIDWCPVPGGEVVIEKQTKEHVEPFYTARYPVTATQHRAFVEADDGWRNSRWWGDNLPRDSLKGPDERGRGGNHPVVNVSWCDAVAFCRWLGHRLGCTVGLPDEFQWQQSATGGLAGRTWPWGSDWDVEREPYLANTSESRLRGETAVGMYPAGASPAEALDLAGNVWEWCLNKFDTAEIEETRSGGRDFASRVLRGGSWSNYRDVARSAVRNWYFPLSRSGNIGFRVVCSSPSSGH